MSPILPAAALAVLLALAFAAWRRYLWAEEKARHDQADTSPDSLTDVLGDRHLVNVPHQKGVRWLSEVFSRTAQRYPDHTALQVPHTGESLTYAELDGRAEGVAAALAPFVTGPDQVVAVAMEQDSWHIVACHLGILRAGGAVMFLDTTLPETLIAHMLEDAHPAVVITRGQDSFRDIPTLDVLKLPQARPSRTPPPWLDDPKERLAALLYTSGSTGRPKGVECPHAGYVNLALSYAEYFDLVPGVDATSLTSSLGYDGSISEMYSAWVSGCAVVLLTKEEVRSGPELLPVLREAEVTVLFCPPVLLTTLTPSPELDLPYPLCRYVVPAGEAFPPALVEPWTRARRQIINTYGPTEASTDTSRQSLRPGEPVTIGTPFANVTYVILEPEGLEALPHGEVGELCIGGVHLARGYRNLPEQTARSFIPHPRFGRLYRTGDRCRVDPRTLRVHYLGRIDAQLKVRGHRVETQPVEDILQDQFGEIETAVLDYQNRELVAFVAAPTLAEDTLPAVAPAPAEWAARVTATLAQQLPPPSVPTRFFLVGEFALKPVSGKIDRERLPRLSRLPAGTHAQGRDPAPDSPPQPSDHGMREARPDEIAAGPEPDHQEVLALCRAVLGTPLGWDDAFVDHGGHSVAIAELAAQLRATGWGVSVRSLLSDRDTARKVALSPRELPTAGPSATSRAARSPRGRDEAATHVLPVGLFTTLQTLFLLLLYSPALAGFLGLVTFGRIGEFFLTAHLWEFIGVGLLIYLLSHLLPFATLGWVMAIKLLMGGHPYKNRVTPGVYPQWSRMHLRTWCIQRLEQSVLRPLALGSLFRSAPLLAYMLRQLGATVGPNLQCAQDADLLGPLDLLTIEDDVAIQTGAYVHTSRWVSQNLHIGPVRLERGCKIGMRAAIADHVTVGRGAWVTPFTAILGDVGPGEMWEGSPGRPGGRYTQLNRAARHCQYASPIWVLEALNVLMQVVLDLCLMMVPTAAVAWLAVGYLPARRPEVATDYFQVTPFAQFVWHMGLYAVATTLVSLVLVSVLGCLFLRWTASMPGLYPVRGLRGAFLLYRMKLLNQIQRQWTWTITGQYLRALAGLRFTRLGASECDFMLNLVPEAASAHALVFWSHACFTNMLDYGAQHLTLRPLEMPVNFFSGNNSVAESGHLPSNFLLGVSTPGSDVRFRRQMRSRPAEALTVAGSPPVRFASTLTTDEAGVPIRPSLPLFLTRVLLNDVCNSGILRVAELVAYVILYTVLLRWSVPVLVSALTALVLTELALVTSSVVVKRLLVGREWGSAHSTPFWSLRHFTYFFAQDCFFAWCRGPLQLAAGTVLPNVVLRWMGCRIGQRTLVSEPLQASDWNAVSFGDDCVVAGFLQYHTLENMTLKVKRTDIQDRSAVSFGATVMGGAVLQPETTLLPLSMVLKEMRLPTGLYWGSPTESAGPALPEGAAPDDKA